MKQGRGIPPPSFLPNSSMEGERTTNSSDTSEIMGISWESEVQKWRKRLGSDTEKKRKRDSSVQAGQV